MDPALSFTISDYSLPLRMPLVLPPLLLKPITSQFMGEITRFQMLIDVVGGIGERTHGLLILDWPRPHVQVTDGVASVSKRHRGVGP
jgi:hypothetical protein